MSLPALPNNSFTVSKSNFALSQNSAIAKTQTTEFQSILPDLDNQKFTISQSDLNNWNNVSFSNKIDVDFAIYSIKSNTTSIPEQDKQLGALFIQVLENSDFEGAHKVLNSVNSQEAKNIMHRGLIQELMQVENYDTAIDYNNSFSNSEVQTEQVDYISNYLSFYGHTTKAAKTIGSDNFFTRLTLKTNVVVGKVGDTLSNLVTDLNPWSSKGDIISLNADNLVGNKYRSKQLGGGRLACAHVVSKALTKVSGLEDVSSNECNRLSKKMVENGFKKLSGSVNYKPGDVVFFTRSGKEGYGHVGIVAEVKDGVPYMVHNSSSKKQVVKVNLNNYYKKPVATYRHSA